MGKRESGGMPAPLSLAGAPGADVSAPPAAEDGPEHAAHDLPPQPRSHAAGGALGRTLHDAVAPAAARPGAAEQDLPQRPAHDPAALLLLDFGRARGLGGPSGANLELFVGRFPVDDFLVATVECGSAD